MLVGLNHRPWDWSLILGIVGHQVAALLFLVQKPGVPQKSTHNPTFEAKPGACLLLGNGWGGICLSEV